MRVCYSLLSREINREIERHLAANPRVSQQRIHLKDISLQCFEVDCFAVIACSSQADFAKARESILCDLFKIVKEHGGEFAFDNVTYSYSEPSGQGRKP